MWELGVLFQAGWIVLFISQPGAVGITAPADDPVLGHIRPSRGSLEVLGILKHFNVHLTFCEQETQLLWFTKVNGQPYAAC